MFPAIKELNKGDDWIFVQDSALPQRSNLVQDFLKKHFETAFRLKTKTKAVWRDCATNLKPLRKAIKQFVPSLRAVEEKQGYCIKMIFC